jgi:protein associated with RNAse G/E
LRQGIFSAAGKKTPKQEKKIPINVYEIKLKEFHYPPKAKLKKNVKNVLKQKGKEFSKVKWKYLDINKRFQTVFFFFGERGG